MGSGELKCDHQKKYCRKYDSQYCETCDSWTEGKCGDKDCDFCKERPDKPSQVSEEKD
jgi:hypothetical protein